MENAELVKTVLLAAFFFVGALLVLLGVLIWRKLWNCCSVEVEAECIDLGLHTETIGVSPDRTHFYGAKRPVYRYYYEGKRYESGPRLSSNRRGYRPELGSCTIRIDPNHPEKVYSPERRYAALMLILIGAMWLVLAGLTAFVLPMLVEASETI